MNLINIENLTKVYTERKLFDNTSFSLQDGEKVGVIGINGTGKTTLLRMIMGEEETDEGTVTTANHVVMRYLPQHPEFEPEKSSLECVLEGNVTEENRWSVESDAKAMMTRLGIKDFMQPAGQLSGGQRKRLALISVLLSPADILLLDEPTNHLDNDMADWLEDYLLHFKGTVLAISHDRYFLDKVVQRCIEIDEGRAEFYSGGYSFYVEERQRRFEEKLKKYEKDQAKIEQLTRAAEQMHLWAFMGNDKLHKRAFSMERRIEKLSRSEKPAEWKKISVKFREREFNGDEALVIEGLSKRFGEKRLFSDLSLSVAGAERIALIGDNGSGKSTLIKMIMGQEAPDEGYLYMGPAVRAAYLPQIVSFSEPSRSALDTMLYDCRCQPQEARDRLAAFGFRGEDVFTPVGALSGGEKSRLRLCMLMGSDINLLILDEPTNHLDIASREWMEDALADYAGTLLFVSHDRYFIEKFAGRIWAMEDGGISDFRGGYQDFCAWRERRAVFIQTEKAAKKKKEPKKPRSPGTDKLLARTEREIGKLEEKIAALDAESEKYAADYQKLLEIESEKEPLNEELMALYEKWEALSQ